MQVYTARRTEKIKGMPLGEEQLTMPHAAAQSCVEEAITFRLLPVWMPALRPQDHSLAQPPSVRRKQWFSAPRVVYQLPYRSSNGSSKAQPQLARTGGIINVGLVGGRFRIGKATHSTTVSEAWDA